MPRKSRLLPYVQASKGRRLSYVRRIPQQLQQFLGGQQVLRHSLGVKASDCSDPAVISAWSAVNAEVEALLAEAEAKKLGVLQRKPEVTPLSLRDSAAIGAEPWRQLLSAGDTGSSTPTMENMLAEVVLMVLQAASQLGELGDIEQAEQVKAAITQRLLAETLNKLQIQPDPKAMEQMQKRLFGYIPMLGADLQKRGAGDFSAGDIESKPPPLPKGKVTWDQVLEQYLISVGGITEVDGIGVGKDRIKTYRRYIKEFQTIIGKHFPDEVDIEDARQYANHLAKTQLKPPSQSKRIRAIRHLYRIAISYGLVNCNPLGTIQVPVPKGVVQQTCRPFTKDELKIVYKFVHQSLDVDRHWVFDALIATGARASEIICLRYRDIGVTDAGIRYIHFKHEPLDKYPTKLKAYQEGERMIPMHSILIKDKYQELLNEGSEGYIVNHSTTPSSWSGWFKNQILEPLGIYEHKSTSLHSIRNTSIDLWREAAMSAEFRRAFVAHAAKDVQDKKYGAGLKMMPDVLANELAKVDLGFLS